LKRYFLLFTLLFSLAATAQKVDSIYVHLYTDSLKKGTYNYINIDGKLTNGRFLPLDSTDLNFSSSDGKFFGNSLWLNPDFNKDKVAIRIVLRSNPTVFKEFTMYIKKNPDGHLRSLDEIMNEPKTASNKSRRKKN